MNNHTYYFARYSYKPSNNGSYKNYRAGRKLRKCWEDATRQAVHEGSKTLYNIRSVRIREQRAVVEHGQIISYQVTVDLSFEIEDR